MHGVGLVLLVLLALLKEHLLGQAWEHLSLVLAGEGCDFLGCREVQNEVIDEVENDKDKKGESHKEWPDYHNLDEKRVSHATVLNQEETNGH